MNSNLKKRKKNKKKTSSKRSFACASNDIPMISVETYEKAKR